VAHLTRDHDIMETAREEAETILSERGIPEPVLAHLDDAWTRRFELAGVG
jgi:hypothetical protein